MPTPYTVPNQRVVTVHRERAASDFLGIKNAHWQYAARDLGAHALMLYLYFAANKDNYTLALSPKAIREAVGMPPQTYRDQFVKLLDKGYLVDRGKNHYDFYELPQREPGEKISERLAAIDTPCVSGTDSPGDNEPPWDREINIDIINNNINNGRREKQVSPTPSGFLF